MSLTDKSISFRTILAKVYRDLQLKDDEGLFGDILEWAAEAMDFIGVYNQYDDKEDCVEVKNYKGEIPTDVVEIVQMFYNGMVINTDTSTSMHLKTSTDYKYLTPYSYNQDKIKNVLLRDTKYIIGSGETFQINNGWIKTSFKEGKINIVYQGLRIDKEGFPKIPDDQSYKEALYWYIVYKVTYAQARRGDINSSFYTDAYDKWNWYCNQAGANAMMPSLAQLESYKRSFISLVPDFNKFNKGFRNE